MSLTLGDVLHAAFKVTVPERDWAKLVHAIAAGDQLALHALYERSHRIVFTLIMRITANREMAEELAIDVFHDIWQRAREYDAANNTVLGWIMNLARARALTHMRSEKPDPGDGPALGKQREALRAALAALTSEERQAIESIFFAGLTHGEAAARLDQPLGNILRSGLHKLRHAARGEPMTAPDEIACGWSEVTCAYIVHALPADEVETVIAHITACPGCHREMETLRPVVDSFVAWPADILRPRASLQARLARRLAEKTGAPPELPPSLGRWSDPQWTRVAPGIECTLLATDADRQRVSMLVRLAPGANYPAHTHAGHEELHLLDGELWINDRKLLPGDYNYGPPGAYDARVYSETGCTCLLGTSTADRLN